MNLKLSNQAILWHKQIWDLIDTNSLIISSAAKKIGIWVTVSYPVTMVLTE